MHIRSHICIIRVQLIGRRELIIEVKFVNTSNIDSNGELWSETYPEVYIAKDKADSYMLDFVVHPAFNFGTDKLTGMWIGKFESSFQGTGTTKASGQSSNTNNALMIKAGVSSWRMLSINDMYRVCKNVKSKSIYGLNDKALTHLMKNDQWGACAYLTNSRYGIETKVLAKNDNLNFITGNGESPRGLNEWDTDRVNSYKTSYGQTASTTGNVYGVYDMCGGGYEYTAGYVDFGSLAVSEYGGDLRSDASSGENDRMRYVNRYYSSALVEGGEYKEWKDYDYMNPKAKVPDGFCVHFGDALYETSDRKDTTTITSWINNGRSKTPFIHSVGSTANQFFIRGGNEYIAVSQYDFGGQYGHPRNDTSFRLSIIIP